MTIDTTASNTGHVSAAYITIQRQRQMVGHVSAACITIQRQRQLMLLWSVCRHHIGKVLLTHVFSDLKIDVSKSPDVLFTRFRMNFYKLQHNTDQPLAHLGLSLFTGPAQKLLEDCKATVIQLTKNELKLRQDDCLEFMKLCMLFLDDGSCPVTTPATILQ